MYKPQRLLLALLTALLFFQMGIAQQKNEQSLLWSISGNGLKSPSYLFGTMHVRNKQAFNFKDSLYHFIEKTDGFAMEIHPDSMGQVLTAVLNGRIQVDESRADKNFSERDFEKMLEKISKDKSVKKKSRKEKLDLVMQKLTVERVEKDSSMNTFMDGFLYSLAKENNKSIYGLEEVEDQIDAFSYLRNGLKLNALAENIDNIQNWSTPPLYTHYYNEKVDSIYSFYTSYFTDSALYGFLYKRNFQMVEKMDSLMRLQSIFTAVGAGHLPGDNGIINLLRKNGYVVEPVHSDKKIFAGDFKRKVYEEEWVAYENTSLGYKYETPTAITKQAAGNGAAIEYSLDLMNGLMFMNISRPLKSVDKKLGLDSLFTLHNNQMIENVKGFNLSQKQIEVNGYKAIQSSIGTLKDGYSQLTYIVDDRNIHILIVSSEKKENLENKRVKRFVESFRIIPAKSEWKTINDRTSFFSIKIPNVEEVNTKDLNSEEVTTVVYGGYSGIDPLSSTIFTVYHTRATPGNELLSGYSFFNSFIYNVQSAMEGGDFESADTMMFGYPAKKFKGTSEKGESIQGLIVRRNNIGYFISAEYDVANEDSKVLEEFFESFALNKFDESGWQTNSRDGFSVKVPSVLKNFSEDSLSTDLHLIATDKYSNVSYHVEKDKINKYYWAVNEDSLYSYWKDRLVKYYDSVIKYDDWVHNGVKGRQMETYDTINKVSRKWIFFVNGSNVLTAYANKLPGQDNSIHFNDFFNSFQFQDWQPFDSLFLRTPEMLFRDLQSEDSTIFSEAYASLDEVSFYDKDLTLLLEKTLVNYPSPEFVYSSVHQQLWRRIRLLVQSNPDNYHLVKQFIKENYSATEQYRINQRSEMLSVLAGQKTSDSYNDIARLLESYTEMPEAHTFFYKLYDSLQLTQTLYPMILKCADDTLSALPLASLTKMMLDSNLISAAAVKSVEQAYINLANSKLKYISGLEVNDYDYDYELEDVISLLGYLNSGSSEQIIKKYGKVKNISIRFAAIATLIKNNKSVNASDIKKLAESDNYRVRLYESLEKNGKVSLLPSAFAAQKEMGKGYIFNSSNDEDEMADGDMTFELIKNIETEFQGSKKRFILYRVTFTAEDSDEPDHAPIEDSYLGVAGPFDLNEKTIAIPVKDNISGLYYDSNFDPIKTDIFFRNFIKQALKYR